jgi:uncharacterized protein VirK/YbjX
MTINFRKLFEQTDNFDGGRIQTFKRMLKLWLRVQTHRKEMKKLNQYLDKHSIEAIKDHMPHLQLKCLRSYLWKSLNSEQRIQAQLNHLDWMLSYWSTEKLILLYQYKYFTFFQWKSGEYQFKFEVGPSRGMHREGDLEAYLRLNGETVLRTSFSIIPNAFFGIENSGYSLFIGGVQGGKNAKELTSLATKILERTKPPHVLLNIFQGFAETWKLDFIIGVTQDQHIYSGYSKTLAKRVILNYDLLWKELGGETLLNGIGWLLPRKWVPRSIEDVEAKKRSQLKRRNEIRQQIQTLASESAKNWGQFI